MKTKASDRPVLVTTAHRGVFFGYAGDTSELPKSIALRKARNCIYWPVENKGFIGLATSGPAAGAKVGPAADIQLFEITSVVECTPDAAEKWEQAPWSR
jgi:hypothetical protein